MTLLSAVILKTISFPRSYFGYNRELCNPAVRAMYRRYTRATKAGFLSIKSPCGPEHCIRSSLLHVYFARVQQRSKRQKQRTKLAGLEALSVLCKQIYSSTGRTCSGEASVDQPHPFLPTMGPIIQRIGLRYGDDVPSPRSLSSLVLMS